MCIYEAAIGEPPFATLDDESVREILRSGEIPEKSDELSAEAWKLVVSMTNFDPAKRIGLSQVLLKLKSFAEDEHQNQAQPFKLEERSYSYVANTASLSQTNSRVRNSTSSIADLLEDIDDAHDREQEKLLLQLVRTCVNAEQRTPMYEANRIDTATGLVRNGRTCFAKLYALQSIKWSVISDAKVPQADFDAHRECVPEPSQSEIASVVNALINGTDAEKDEAVVRCACIATKANGDRVDDSGAKQAFPAIKRSSGEVKLWAGMVQPLITLLRSGNNEMQKVWTAEALGDLTLENDTIRSEILRGNAIKTFVTLLRVGTPEQKYRAAYALASLANNKDCCAEMIQKEAIPQLLALLMDGTDEQKLQAVCTFGRLSLNKEAADKMVQQGVLAPLIKLVRSEYSQQKVGATAALKGIVQSKFADRADVGREKVVGLLVALVLVGTNQQKENAANALGVMSLTRQEARVTIVREGGISPLLAFFQSGTNQQKSRVMNTLKIWPVMWILVLRLLVKEV